MGVQGRSDGLASKGDKALAVKRNRDLGFDRPGAGVFETHGAGQRNLGILGLHNEYTACILVSTRHLS